ERPENHSSHPNIGIYGRTSHRKVLWNRESYSQQNASNAHLQRVRPEEKISGRTDPNFRKVRKLLLSRGSRNSPERSETTPHSEKCRCRRNLLGKSSGRRIGFQTAETHQ